MVGGDSYRSGRAVAQTNQDTTHSRADDSQADPELLQWTEFAPLASTDEVYCCDAKDEERAENDDGNAELALGDHGAHIIAQPCEGATLGPEMRIGR